MKNNFKIIRQEVEIYTYSRGKREIILIDLADFPLVDSIEGSWCLTGKPGHRYVCTCWRSEGRRFYLYLHRFIVKAPIELDVDHWNHNTLDNRRSNLRITTKSKNLLNRSGATKANKSSGVRGVYYDKRYSKWAAKITIDKKPVWLGYHDSLAGAAQAVNERIKRVLQ